MLAKSILLLVLPLAVLGGVLEPRAIPWGTPSRPYRDGPGDAPGRLPPPVRAQPARANTAPPPPTAETVKKPAQRKNAGTQQADVHRMSEGNSIALFNGKPVDPNTGNLIIKNTNEKRGFPVLQLPNGQIYTKDGDKEVELLEEGKVLEKRGFPVWQLPNGQIYTKDGDEEDGGNTLEKRDLRKKLNLDFLSSPDTDEDAMHGHLRSGSVGQFQAPGTDRRPIDYNGYSDPAYAAYQPYPDGYYPETGHQKSTAHVNEEEELAEEQEEELEEVEEVETGPEQIEWKGRSITVFNGQPVQGAAKKKALDIINKRGLDSSSTPHRQLQRRELWATIDANGNLQMPVGWEFVPGRGARKSVKKEKPNTVERRDNVPARYYQQRDNGQVYDVEDVERKVEKRNYVQQAANGQIYTAEEDLDKEETLEKRGFPVRQLPNGQIYTKDGDKEVELLEGEESVLEKRGSPVWQLPNGQIYTKDGDKELELLEEEEKVLGKRNYVQQAANGQIYTTDEELDRESDLPHLHARDFKSRLRNNGSGRKKGVSSDDSESPEESQEEPEEIEDAVARAPSPVAEPTLEDLANGQSFVIRNGVPIEAGKTRNVRVKKPRPAFPARDGQVDSSVIKRSTNAEATPGKKIPNLNPFGRNPITRNKGKDNNSNAKEKTNGNTNSETVIGEARVVRSPNSQENEHVKVNKGKDYVLFNGQPVSVGGGVPGAKGGESDAKSMPGLAGRVGPL